MANNLLYTIELSGVDREQFLIYLATTRNESCALHNCIPNWNIRIDNDNKSTIAPYLGKYEWQHEDEVFQIEHVQEGQPVDHCGFPVYFHRLSIRHKDMAKLKAFVTIALTYIAPIDKNKIKLYHAKSRGYWESLHTIYGQPLEKIYLDDQVKGKIIQDIDTFVANRERYILHGRCYKLNYLLTDLPGSGKSSIVKAIAIKYHRPIYVLNISKALTDDMLTELFSEIKDNSILLIEDVDAFFVDRKAIDINVSFSCLINVLDGPLCKGNGLITFMTTNHPDRLDPALIRPGRVDHIVRFDYPTRKQIAAAFKDLTEGESASDSNAFDEFYKKIRSTKINMSGIVDYLFRHPTDYMDHVNELLDSVAVINDILKQEGSAKMYT